MAFADLEKLALFDGISKRDLKAVRSICTPVVVDAGHQLTTIGTHGRECMLIESGTVEVIVADNVIAQVGPGELIGELALLDGPGTERNATTVATMACELLVFTRAEFDQLMRTYPTVGERIQAVANARRTETETLV